MHKKGMTRTLKFFVALCCENVVQFKCLGMTVTKQILIQGEIKRRLNSGNAYYQTVQSL
jgi:hypothetical protein